MKKKLEGTGCLSEIEFTKVMKKYWTKKQKNIQLIIIQRNIFGKKAKENKEEEKTKWYNNFNSKFFFLFLTKKMFE